MAYKRIFLFLLMAITAQITLAQLVNAYAQVTSIVGTTLNLGTIEETYDTFENGEFVIVMQMQGVTINTTSSSSFGTITSINSAGLFEIGVIASHTASSITLVNPLTNTYNAATGAVQVVSYPTLGGTGDFTTTTNLRARKWSGVIGGVIAFNVEGDLYLAHSISADSMGFDWGEKYGDASSTTCTFSSKWREALSFDVAYKGAGLINPTSGQICGRAPIANGGGGGVGHNGGGGGGGNYTGGGNGYPGTDGWCIATGPGDGKGGYGLSAYIPADSIYRIFMGGGGGGGHENNGKGSHGGYGGGIIIIEADSIFSDCSGSVKISANASDAPSKKNDGQGGGGAGGSIILYTEYIGAEASCPISVEANGGDGGTVNHGDDHGAGGGGGQGLIYVDAEESDLMPMDYLTFATDNGDGGLSCTTGCDPAEDGDGLDDIGIFFGEAPILPVDLLSFEAIIVNQSLVSLEWVTASEHNCDHFELFRSADGEHWEAVAMVSGNGTTNETSYYSWPDETPLSGWNYYLLKQVDTYANGKFSKVRSVYLPVTTADMYVYPNPVINQTISIHSGEDLQGAAIALFNLQGQRIPVSIQSSSEHDLTVQTDVLPAGYYLLTIKTVQGNIVSYTLLAE
jgi:hypothetical protein